MDAATLLQVLFVVAFLAVVGLGLQYLIPILMEHFRGSFSLAGGWKTLSGIYATSREPQGEILKRQSLVAGAVVYRYLVTVGMGEAGLYLAVGGPLPRPPILIPWRDFTNAAPARLFWQKAALVSIGAPEVSSLTVPLTLYDKMRPHLPAALASFDAATKPA